VTNRNSIVIAYSSDPEPIEIHRGFSVTHSHPRHWHDEYLICAITGGGGYTEYRGNAYFTPPGSLFILPPGEIHSNYATKDGCSYANVYLSAARVESTGSSGNLRTSFFPPQVVFDEAAHRSLLNLCNVLEFTHTRLQGDTALLHLFTSLNRCTGQQHFQSSPAQPRINLVREYLDAHFDQDVELEFLAQLAGISPFHLNRLFRIQVGIPPHAYQVQRRIALAKVLLRDGWAIARVAHRTGFADQSHFTRHFKRAVGTTPGQFVPERKNVQDVEFAAD